MYLIPSSIYDQSEVKFSLDKVQVVKNNVGPKHSCIYPGFQVSIFDLTPLKQPPSLKHFLKTKSRRKFTQLFTQLIAVAMFRTNKVLYAYSYV